MIGRIIIFTLLGVTLLSSYTSEPVWGFFGHRKINRMAVFTLPEDMLLFYKKNIDFVTEHAVDPDKRRYATKNEFARHYIDIDHWDTLPFPNVPRLYRDAILKFGSLNGIINKDTLVIDLTEESKIELYNEVLYLDRFSAIIKVDSESVPSVLKGELYDEYFYNNDMVNYGIAPYFLEHFYSRLVWAFEKRNREMILQISADIGHYISDIHVPLHTTLNYNGQMTDQIGIHAFWESRLPELYSEESYDFMVGKAEYISDIRSYIWDIVTESHRLLPEVLAKEIEVKESFPEDQQFCYDERLERTIWTQCPEFSKAYHESMGDMVERRMQESILSVGSFWYTAWIEAGQPELHLLVDGAEVIVEEEKKKLDAAYQNGKIYGREH